MLTGGCARECPGKQRSKSEGKVWQDLCGKPSASLFSEKSGEGWCHRKLGGIKPVIPLAVRQLLVISSLSFLGQRRLSKSMLCEGGLGESGLSEGGLCESGLSEGGLSEGVLSESGLSEGVLSQDRLGRNGAAGSYIRRNDGLLGRRHISDQRFLLDCHFNFPPSRRFF